MKQPEGKRRDELMALLHATVGASHGEVYTCGHYYSKHVVNERPMITVWSHRSTLDAHDRHMDSWTADLLVRQADTPDYSIEQFGGSLADWHIILD